MIHGNVASVIGSHNKVYGNVGQLTGNNNEVTGNVTLAKGKCNFIYGTTQRVEGDFNLLKHVAYIDGDSNQYESCGGFSYSSMNNRRILQNNTQETNVHPTHPTQHPLDVILDGAIESMNAMHPWQLPGSGPTFFEAISNSGHALPVAAFDDIQRAEENVMLDDIQQTGQNTMLRRGSSTHVRPPPQTESASSPTNVPPHFTESLTEVQEVQCCICMIHKMSVVCMPCGCSKFCRQCIVESMRAKGVEVFTCSLCNERVDRVVRLRY